MELSDLMGRIINKNVPQFIIMFGDEQKVADIYIDKIESLGYKRYSLDSVSQAVSKCSTKSLDKSKKLYLVNEDKEFTKAEQSWDKVKEIVRQTSNILVIRYAKINKTYKFYKRNKEDIVEFPKLGNDILTKYIQKELSDLSIDNCETLIGACSSDYGRILLEIDKVQHYKIAKSLESSNTAFRELYDSGAIYSDIGDITFELTNAVTSGDLAKSFLLLEQAKRSGEPALRICSILYSNFKNMLSILCLGKDRSNASARTGIEPRICAMTMRQVGSYNIQECIRNVSTCQRVETGIKNGSIDADIALDYLITSLLY